MSSGTISYKMLWEMQEAARAKRASQCWESSATEVIGIAWKMLQWGRMKETGFSHLKFLLLRNLEKGPTRQGTTLSLISSTQNLFQITLLK